MDNVPTSSCINHPRYLQLSGVVFIWVPSLACDPTTVKDLQKTPSKVSQQSFSGLTIMELVWSLEEDDDDLLCCKKRLGFCGTLQNLSHAR
jgi:hypothetical protein